MSSSVAARSARTGTIIVPTGPSRRRCHRSGRMGEEIGRVPFELTGRTLRSVIPSAMLEEDDGLFGYALMLTRYGAMSDFAAAGPACPDVTAGLDVPVVAVAGWLTPCSARSAGGRRQRSGHADARDRSAVPPRLDHAPLVDALLGRQDDAQAGHRIGHAAG